MHSCLLIKQRTDNSTWAQLQVQEHPIQSGFFAKCYQYANGDMQGDMNDLKVAASQGVHNLETPKMGIPTALQQQDQVIWIFKSQKPPEERWMTMKSGLQGRAAK